MNRKNFLSLSTGMVGAGMLAGVPRPLMAMTDFTGISNKSGNITLKNVLLETGFESDEFEITATKTSLFVVEIRDGKIFSIQPNSNLKDAVDAKGYLMLPAMKDMHIHLDKTFYGGPWKARSKKQKSVVDMIKLEEQIIPQLLPHSTERAEKIIELLQFHGTDFARSHCNVEPTSKLDSLKNLQQAILNKKNSFGVEIVAFPQHGLLYSRSESLMKEAAQMDIDFIGGLDPTTIDKDMTKSMDLTIRLALDYKKGIDIHLHESGDSGLETIEYLTKRVMENPTLKGKTFVSHAFALGRLEQPKLDQVCANLAEAGIGIISTVPIGKSVMPIPTLYKHKVKVMTGTDSVIDHWSTFGSGNMLGKANLLAQLYGWSDELALSRCLRIATDDILPLDDKGEQLWPKAGDVANFNLFKASCSAEAVARVPQVRARYYNGVEQKILTS